MNEYLCFSATYDNKNVGYTFSDILFKMVTTYALFVAKHSLNTSCRVLT